MKATLTNLKTGVQFELLSVAIVGRSSESNIQIDDQRASRRHAMIRKQENGFWIFDLGSFNGSYLNGARLTSAKQLNDGDTINFADHEFRFQQAGMSQLPDEEMNQTIALIRSKSVIILVSDIQGFTSLSEVLPPDDLAQVMGSWYSECESIVSNYGATVDKFIGDCVLAYWTDINDATLKNSVLAGRALLGSCHKIYEQHQSVFDSAGRKFGAGVGIHTGKVAYGGMSQGEFTLIGDPVNTTFRIEALTRDLAYDLVATTDFMTASGQLSPYANNLGHMPIKGRDDTMEIWGFHSYPEG